MRKKSLLITDFLLYRIRYVIGYGLLGAALIASILIAAFVAPGGINQQEIAFLAQTNQLSWSDPLSFIQTNAPLHLLQLASLSLLGTSILSIKLPVIILSVITTFVVLQLLRRWFKQNIAILTMIITVTTGQFIFMAQNATEMILYALYVALFLLFSTLIIQRSRCQQLWKISLVATMALSLYTPYFVYLVVALVLVGLIHPHTRYHFLKRDSLMSWTAPLLIGGALVAPLVWAIIKDIDLGYALAGVSQLGNITIIDNLKTLFQHYFWFEPIVQGAQLVPVLDVSALVLILMGLVMTWRNHHSARSYMIFVLIILALPVMLIAPDINSLMTVPLFILLAVGLETLIRQWYQLFPRNPYARATGLIALIALVSVMTLSGVERFSNGYRYTPALKQQYSYDLSLLDTYLQSHQSQPIRLVVDTAEQPVYEALKQHAKQPAVRDMTLLTAADLSSAPPLESSTLLIVSRGAKARANPSSESLPNTILTSARSKNADRFYIYQDTTP